MHIRPVAALVSVAALAALATGCEDPAGADPAAEPPATEQPEGDATDPAGDPSPAEEPSGDTDAGGQPDADLGRTLDLGTTSVVTHTSGSATTTLAITAKSVTKGKIEDLDQLSLTAAEREYQPYYVTMEFRYVDGDRPRATPLQTTSKLRDTRGEEGKLAFTMDDEVAQCVNERNEELAKGGSTTLCRVFMLKKGQTAGVIAYRTDYKKEPVFWKAGD